MKKTPKPKPPSLRLEIPRAVRSGLEYIAHHIAVTREVVNQAPHVRVDPILIDWNDPRATRAWGYVERAMQWIEKGYTASRAPSASSAAATLARRASATYSEARAAAARANGKKGGRPRKPAHTCHKSDRLREHQTACAECPACLTPAPVTAADILAGRPIPIIGPTSRGRRRARKDGPR